MWKIHILWMHRFARNTKARWDANVLSANEISEKLSAVKFRQRGTLLSLEIGNSLSSSLLSHFVKGGQVHSHTNTVKHYLSDQNKRDRAKCALHFVRGHVSSLPWSDFWLCSLGLQVVLIDSDQTKSLHVPKREASFTKSEKRYITKVNRLCADTRPRYDHHRKSYFYDSICLSCCAPKVSTETSLLLSKVYANF